MAGSAVDAQLFQGIVANTNAFTLKGGGYLVSAIGDLWNGGSVELQALGPDQSTWLSLPTPAKLSSNGIVQISIPPGQYRFAVTLATVSCSVAGIPL